MDAHLASHGMAEFMAPPSRSSALRTAFEEALKGFLPHQRWFAGKVAGVDAVQLLDVLPITHETALVHVQVASGGMASVYQLPLIALPHKEAISAILDIPHPDGTRWALCDGAAHPAFWEGFIAWWQNAPQLHPDATGLTAVWLTEPLQAQPAIPLKGEQSNASALVGGKAFPKLYRTLHEGPNPEVELLQALSEAGETTVPRVMGVVSRVGPSGSTPLALAVEALNAPRDVWGVLLDLLRNNHLGEATKLIAQIGAGLANLHRALGALRGEGFTPEPLSPPDLTPLQREAALVHDLLSEAQREALHREISGMATLDLGIGTRIHGDLHLGQIVLASDEVTFLDFEGEPARTLVERRALDSPLRDVAGLVRSLHYALATVSRERGLPPETIESPLTLLSDALWKAWHPAMAQTHLLPPDPSAALRYYVLQKVLYEIRYERGSRPDWVWIPLGGLVRFLC